MVQFVVRNNFFVIIDNHSDDNPVLSNPALWTSLWTALITDLIVDPISQQRVLVDILNEPGSSGLSWQMVSADYSLV